MVSLEYGASSCVNDYHRSEIRDYLKIDLPVALNLMLITCRTSSRKKEGKRVLWLLNEQPFVPVFELYVPECITPEPNDNLW